LKGDKPGTFIRLSAAESNQAAFLRTSACTIVVTNFLDAPLIVLEQQQLA
jgi:hypothetical protein